MRETKAIREARAAETDPYRRRFCYRGWTTTVSVTQEHRLMRRLPEFAHYTNERHIGTAIDFLHTSMVLQAMHADIVRRAEFAYGDHGPLVSGVIRDHFPAPVKDALRILAHAASKYQSRSLAHWQAAGRRLQTWRARRDTCDRQVATQGVDQQ